MRTFTRSAAVAVGLFAILGSVGCDDEGGGGGPPNTTLTTVTVTTTSSTVTTTTVSTTTTTTGGGGNSLACAVTWGVSNDVTLGALQFDTSYTNAQGEFEGSADQVVCTDLTGSLASFNDVDAERRLSAGLISLGGIDAPRDVIRCNFNTPSGDTTPPVAGDFAITVIDATDPSLNPVTATMAITDITCTPVGGGTTTTAPATTTTAPVTTTTGGGGSVFTIGFNLVDAVNIGALQFSVDYSGAPGGFDGAADQVECFDRTSSLASFNDDEGTTTLNAGLINLAGFSGPRLVVECNFTSTGTAPVAGDFAVTVEDAAQPDLTPISPLPTVSVAVTAQ